MLCSDSACVTCFNLTSHWCSFIRRLTILSISPMYTCLQKQGILYIPAELSGGLWSLGFLKICPIFLGGLKIVWILCDLFNILPIRSVVPLTYGRMDKILSSDYVSETIVLFAVYWLFWLCLFCRVLFSVRLFLSDWVLSVDVLCQRWWKLYVQVNWLFLCWVVVLTRHVDIYLCVGFLYTWWPIYIYIYIYIYIVYKIKIYIYIYNKIYIYNIENYTNFI